MQDYWHFCYRMNIKLTNFIMRVRTDHMIILFLNTCVHWLCYHSYGHFWSSYFFDYFLIFFLYLWFIFFFFCLLFYFNSVDNTPTVFFAEASWLKQTQTNTNCEFQLIFSYRMFFSFMCSYLKCMHMQQREGWLVWCMPRHSHHLCVHVSCFFCLLMHWRHFS